jgi:cytochrome c oxidase assembly protein subunit 15
VDKPLSGYARFAWGTLAFTLLVILWGAVVRATGSGAGCGSHWPLCNGEVVPPSPTTATLIEYGHRLTSGVALLLVVALWWGARSRFEPGSPTRRAAAWSLFFIIAEALIGAGLVLFEYVADDARAARGFWVGGHLVNTFALVGAMTACAAFASGRGRPAWRGQGALPGLLLAALGGVLLLGVSGAVTALGDTLFPAASFEEGKAATFSETAHLFVRLRIWHPTMAVAVGLLVLGAAWTALNRSLNSSVPRLAASLIGLYVLEMLVGLANIWWLAPVPLQLVHLLLADLAWIVLVLLTLAALAPRGDEVRVPG